MYKDLSHYKIYSEPFMEMGNISAEGAAKLLGQSLTPLELLLRETIQNSWDASIEELTQTRYEVRVRFLKNNEKESLKKFLHELPPNNSEDNLRLNNFLNKDHQLVMEICDFGTKGLGGPFSASKSINQDEANDFVNFVKNIGSHRDRINGAGTYGFGKSSLFKFSKCNTILIDTLTKYEGKLQNRFIGYALGSEYDSNGTRFTGRHWWGVNNNSIENNFSIDPLTDDEAKRIARNLGLTVRNFEEDKGTSLFILDPDIDVIDKKFVPEQLPLIKNKLKLRIQEILLWWAWPKFTPKEDSTYPMECRISIFDDFEPIPNPLNIEPLNLLANALHIARLKKNPIFSTKPKKTLIGYIGEKTDEKKNIVGYKSFRDELGDDALIPKRLHHYALLRPAELVVKYMYKELRDDQPQWGGVFICDDNEEIEKAFAKSEPPAHDDWKPQATNDISPSQKTFVISALRRINNRVTYLSGDKSELDASSESESSENSLAWLASDLGESLLGRGLIGGVNVSKSSNKKKTLKRKKNVKVSMPINTGTRFLDGKIVADFIMEVSGKVGKNVELELNSFVVTEEGNETIAPNGSSPKIIMFETEDHLNNIDFVSNIPNFSNSRKIKPSFILKKDFIKLKVAVEIPDQVAVTLTAEIYSK